MQLGFVFLSQANLYHKLLRAFLALGTLFYVGALGKVPPPLPSDRYGQHQLVHILSVLSYPENIFYKHCFSKIALVFSHIIKIVLTKLVPSG
jgi:hypothetical protein